MSRSPKDSIVEMTEMVLPQHTNAIGSVFGGTVMSWVDIAAATAAMRHARCQVVTASVDALHFLAPVKLGWIVILKASVNFTGKTSCEVGVRVDAENPRTGERFHTATAYLTMVSVDSTGKPVPMPNITPETEQEKRRAREAKIRRESRLSVKQAILGRGHEGER